MRYSRSVLFGISVLFIVQLFNSPMVFSAEEISPTNRKQARASLIPYPRQVEWLKQDFAASAVSIGCDQLPEVSFLTDSIEGVFKEAVLECQLLNQVGVSCKYS